MLLYSFHVLFTADINLEKVFGRFDLSFKVMQLLKQWLTHKDIFCVLIVNFSFLML